MPTWSLFAGQVTYSVLSVGTSHVLFAHTYNPCVQLCMVVAVHDGNQCSEP